jgi:phage terminase small subunit
MKVKAPSHYCKKAKRLYEFVSETFILEPHYENLLDLACQARTRAEESRQAIKKYGLVMTDKYGRVVTRPEVIIEKNSMQIFSRLLRELNLSEDTGEMRRPPSLHYRDRGKQCR